MLHLYTGPQDVVLGPGLYRAWNRRLPWPHCIRYHPAGYRLPRIPLLRLYEKPSSASQPPHHQASYCSVHERFATSTQPLNSLYSSFDCGRSKQEESAPLPSAAEEPGISAEARASASRSSSLPWPTRRPTSSEHFLRSRFAWTLDEFHTPT